jgi:hypothetical protein
MKVVADMKSIFKAAMFCFSIRTDCTRIASCEVQIERAFRAWICQ